jgi:DNA-binding MarR family transcriptional regulator
VADVRGLTDEEQQVWRAYLDVMRLVSDRLQRQLVEDSAMTSAEYDVLLQLSEAEGRQLRMSELADLVVNSRSRLTHTIGRMEARGLVKRRPCTEDGRGVLCVLTDEGQEALVKATPGHLEAVRSGLFGPLDAEDVSMLGQVMDKLRTSLRGTL